MPRRINFSRTGNPQEVVEIVDDVLEPPGPNDVTIEIEAAPVHIADLKFLSGALPFYRELPATPGMEGIGLVYAAGRDVTKLNVGDRVFLPVRVGGHGAWRQFVNLDENVPIAAPAGDAVQLSLMPINGITAYTMLHGVLPLKNGDTIIQNAANSNCGRYLIALAKRMSVDVISVVRRQDVIPDLKALGARHVIIDHDKLADEVADIMQGKPIKMGIDAVAGQATQRIADCVADGATILSYGMLSGEPCMVRPETLFFRNLTLKGFLTFTISDQFSEQQKEEMWAVLPELVASGDIETKIAATYPLDQVQDALAHAARTGAERDGKVIICPNN